MLDEHQDVQTLQQHGVHAEEVDGEYPGSLGMHELSPGRARAARGRIDARGAEDLPDGGRRDRYAEFRHFAVDPAVSPQRILLRQTHDKAGDAPDCRRAARRALPARVVLLRGQLAMPGQQCRWRHRENFGSARTWYQPGQRGEPHPVRWLVPDLADVSAQHRVLVPECQQLSILRHVPAE